VGEVSLSGAPEGPPGRAVVSSCPAGGAG